MPTTTYVEFTAAARGIGARTTSAAVAVDDISAEEDRLAHAILTEGALSDSAFFVAPSSGMNLAVGSGSSKADRYVIAGDVAGQENYIVRLDATSITVAVPAAEPASSRTDEIYLIVADAPYDSGSVSLPRIGYRKGDSGGGAPGVDASWKASAKLATVTVPAADTSIEASQITDNRTYSVAAGAVPPGGVVFTAQGSAVPSGWLDCNGSEISRATYRRLYAAIGTLYGSGDGSTTFNLPDLRGRVPVAFKSADADFGTMGQTGGAKTHTLTAAEIPAHTHSYNDQGLGTAASGATQAVAIGAVPGTTGTGTGGGGAHNNLQPYLTLVGLIKT